MQTHQHLFIDGEMQPASISFGQTLRQLSDQFDAMSHTVSDLIDKQREEMAHYEAMLEEVKIERDEALAQVQDYDYLKRAVWTFFDLMESPAPEWRERAAEQLREVYNRVSRND